MCTVSFYKDNQKIVITHNRDEHINRPLAIAPKKVIIGNELAYYPLDPKSNGTWFGVKTDGSVFVLLNGAEKKHTPKPPYRKSRGLILLDIISSKKIHETWLEINLSNIEPFTIVAFAGDELRQLRWNGNDKSNVRLDAVIPHIWSSATLYSDEIIKKRKAWFSTFLVQKKEIFSSEDFIDFHTKSKKNDLQNGLIINRNQTMLTKNVTQCVIKKKEFILTHFDLIANERTIIIETIK